METGVGVGLGVALMLIAYAIQKFRVLPKIIRMRAVAFVALVGVASAVVPSEIGTLLRQLVDACVNWIADTVDQWDTGWGDFFRYWMLPVLALVVMVVWLGYVLPKAASHVVGDIAHNEFDDDDKAVVWGGALVISMFWASAPGLFGDILRAPIGAFVHLTAPAAARLLGA